MLIMSLSLLFCALLSPTLAVNYPDPPLPHGLEVNNDQTKAYSSYKTTDSRDYIVFSSVRDVTKRITTSVNLHGYRNSDGTTFVLILDGKPQSFTTDSEKVDVSHATAEGVYGGCAHIQVNRYDGGDSFSYDYCPGADRLPCQLRNSPDDKPCGSMPPPPKGDPGIPRGPNGPPIPEN